VTARAAAIGLASRLLTYPAPGYGSDLRAFRDACEALELAGASDLGPLVTLAEGSPVERLQELFTQTFDLTPSCALEVGWHLFGEDYARGEFLARARGLLRTHGIAEGHELPDHLASLLALLPNLDPDTASDLVREAVVPAIDKMVTGLDRLESPFSPLLRVLRRLLVADAPASPEVCHV